MALQSQSRPEPMNATPYHSKVRLSVTLSDKFYIAGDAITGKMELESRADSGLGLGIIMVELVAIEELTSRDHSATSTFIHTRRIYQGPGLPPSNAVLPHPVAGGPPLPAHYHQARRGLTTFLFRLPLPPSSPPSIDFGNGLARIRYEVRASVGVSWKNQNRLVTGQCPVDVLQRYLGDDAVVEEEDGLHAWPAPECLVIGEGGKIWAQARVLGGMLVAGESACVELQVKNHSAKKTSGLHVTLGRNLHLPSPARDAGREVPPPLQISDTLASIAFRGPDYVANPGTEGIAQLVFDVPRTARTVSAHPRHGGSVDEGQGEAIMVKKKTPPLFEVRGVVSVRMSMPLGSKDIVLELPVAIFHPATLPPPPSPEPYPYPAPDAFLVPFSNPNPSTSPPPLLPTPMPMFYAERAQSPLYAYPIAPPPAPPLPSAPALLNGQLAIPLYRPHDGQLWFPPTYTGDPSGGQPPPLRSASAANLSTVLASIPPPGLPVSGTPDHVLHSFPHQQQQQYPPPQPEQTIGHGALAARISHHLRANSRARSVSPPPAPSQSPPPPPTQVEVEVLAPKPMPSPKLVTETLGVDPFAQSFGRVGTRTRSLSVVKLEEMAARAAVETDAKAAADKTLPVPPVPSGKPLGHGGHRRPGAQDIFGNLEQLSAREGAVGTNAEPETVPRTPSLSALSLLRPPQRRDQPVFPSYAEQEASGLDVLERRLVEQVGTRRHPPLPPPPDTDVPAVMADPPPAPVPAPVPVPGKGKGKAAPAVEEPESTDEVLGAGAAVNESAISSLALGAEEDFGGRNANANVNALAGLEVGEREGEGEDVEGEGEDVDADADGRTQRLSKGAGASSGSERGTHKARSRKSAKSDSRDKEKDKGKKAKKKREVRDEEAARLKRSAKGRVAEWLEKLAPPEPERVLAVPDTEVEQDTSLAPEPAPAPTPAPEPAVVATPVVESKPNPRSSGFVSVATLRRAPIALPPPPAPESTPTAPRNVPPVPAARRVANKYPPPPQVEMKYDVKSARGGRGGRVTAVTSIWAEASKAGGVNTPTQAARAGGPATKAKGNPAQPKAAAPKNDNYRKAASIPKPAPAPPAKSLKPMTSIVAPRQPARAAKGEDGRVFVGRGRPTAPTAAAPSKAEREDAPPFAARVPRALFGLGVAAAATPSSPALSSSIATPVLSSTASLAHPPDARARTTRALTPTPPPPSSSPSPQPRTQTQPQPAAAAAAAGPGWRAPLVSGAGLKADLAFGQARLRDLIRRYQGQAA